MAEKSDIDPVRFGVTWRSQVRISHDCEGVHGTHVLAGLSDRQESVLLTKATRRSFL